MEYSQREMNVLIFNLLEITPRDSKTLQNYSKNEDYNNINIVKNILSKMLDMKIFNDEKTFRLFEYRINRIKKANIGLAIDFESLEEEFKYSIVIFNQAMKQFIRDTIQTHKIRKMRAIRGNK